MNETDTRHEIMTHEDRSSALDTAIARLVSQLPPESGAPEEPDPAGDWAGPMGHLTAADRMRFRLFGEGPRQAVPETHIHHAIQRWVARTPDACAVEHGGVTLTYRALNRRANRLAARLVDLGVRPGDDVALFAVRGIPLVVGMLAILKAGAAYVPQDPRIAPEAQLRHVLETTGARVVLTLAEFADTLPVQSGHHVIAVDTWSRSGAPTTIADAADLAGFDPGVPLLPDHGCYVLFTSGTTGRPNGVRVTHRNVCNLLLTEPGGLGIQPGWRVGQILNIGFDMASWEILACLSHGGTLVIRGADIAETVERVDVVIATPSVLARVNSDRCRRVKVVAVAGEPCPRPLADRWASFCTFFNSCGPTEVTIVNTMQRHVVSAPVLSIGRPTPNNTVYVLDEHGMPCPIGEVGEMWAGGDCVSAGYLKNSALNAERYAPDPFLGGGRMMFRTRDLGRWTADGELEHLGRTDDQVKIRGFRVELDSVSAVLESVAGCEQAVTLKLDNETLVSFVAPMTVDTQAARRAVAEALPYYCTPAFVHVLPELPVTSRGKIDKQLLADLARQRRSGLPHLAPGDGVRTVALARPA
ncbi:MAG TPA: amino acid adenylation domain-containing protein [Kineosporiaceae bacterium]